MAWLWASMVNLVTITREVALIRIMGWLASADPARSLVSVPGATAPVGQPSVSTFITLLPRKTRLGISRFNVVESEYVPGAISIVTARFPSAAAAAFRAAARASSIF